jgi:hypothetical protein
MRFLCIHADTPKGVRFLFPIHKNYKKSHFPRFKRKKKKKIAIFSRLILAIFLAKAHTLNG